MGSIAEVLEKISEVLVSVARIEQQIIGFDGKIYELTKKVDGNGSPGLLKRVDMIEEIHRNDDRTKKAIDGIKEKRSDFSTKVTLLVIGMVVSNVGVIIFSILK